ncbi:protein MID1-COMPLEMENTING ACTIVITY 1 [Selaginella moellendorffii]|uniref:protein MID1-COMPLEMENTING ACTIVITY 1 n=1 Tax=Selaginella moellendorffii TaxID=88036 RepID=UPI000D1CC9E1|nr:protein MID1-COMPLEMENTING ACTIVITY 1 [Selaginella moellendorffii]XP_024530895.1 protein MID1-COMPLEMENTING ACTIVITY 1 [Selaginella moellendorffii]|eukprot:XP_024530894.1 protein MID1-COMPLEMENTING ACTIVITY 1 [Selaginella moellendorffii]
MVFPVGDVATVAQIAGLDSLKLIAAVAAAAKNARMHKKNCRNFAQHLKLIGNLLEKLRLSELREHPETSEPLERLEEALRKAYILVNSCKNKSYLYLLAMGWNIVNQFKLRQAEIDRLLQIIPLISLVDNNRAKRELREIQRDQKEYTLDEDELRLQETVLKPDLSVNESRELRRNLSRNYPGLALEEALRKENKKLKKELQKMQSLMEEDQCDVIRRLIDITETDVKGTYEKDPDYMKEAKKYEQSNYEQSNSDAYTYQESHKSNETASKSWQLQDWHHDLYGCCGSPLLCVGTFLCPCCTFATVAATATNGIMPKHAACTNCLIYTMVLSCCFYTCCFRRKLRKLYNIEGGSCDDCWAHFLCFCCALVQEAREIKARERDGEGSSSQKRMMPPSEQCMERDH